MNEKQLIKSCTENDPKAQKKLYETYGPMLMGLCLRYIGKREDAEEVFHDTMIKVFKHIGEFRDQSSFKTWISRIGVNTSLDFLRKRKSTLVIEHISDSILEIGDCDIEFEISLKAEEAMRFLSQLNPNQQIVINMYVIDEMSHKEIASALNISEEASRAQYCRAKRALLNLIQVKTIQNEAGK